MLQAGKDLQDYPAKSCQSALPTRPWNASWDHGLYDVQALQKVKS